MRILFSPNDSLISEVDSALWNVDEVVIPSKLDNYTLIQTLEDLTLFVPTIINQSMALNYDGVNLAIRLYLYCVRNHKTNIRIVLLGVESKQSFLMRYNHPNFMKCPGVDYILFHRDLIFAYNKPTKQIDLDFLRHSLDLLGLKLPDSYKSNHSFVNEWCIYKWSEFMDFDVSGVLSVLQANVYFDYLRTIGHGTKPSTISQDKLDDIKRMSGRVLLIDDNPLWHEFFHNLFINSKVQFESIGCDFKNLKIEEIVQKCETAIRSFDPDIVLLDFRLNDDNDFDVKRRKDISGVKVLKAIKGDSDNVGCAFGSRVLMFTATGKIDHVIALQHFGADGFIFKEHPQKYVGKASTKESIGKMLKIFEEMLSCAPIAKSIVKSFNNWDNCIQALKTNNEIALRVSHVEKVVRTLMNGNFQNMPILKLIYLECFSILESLKDGKEDIYPFIDRLASKSGLDSNRYRLWQDINYMRAALAHGDDTIKFTFNRNKAVINETIISKWLINLCDFIFGILDLYRKQN